VKGEGKGDETGGKQSGFRLGADVVLKAVGKAYSWGVQERGKGMAWQRRVIKVAAAGKEQGSWDR